MSKQRNGLSGERPALQDLGRLAMHTEDVLLRNVKSNHKALAMGQLEDLAGYLRDWDAEVKRLHAVNTALLLVALRVSAVAPLGSPIHDDAVAAVARAQA